MLAMREMITVAGIERVSEREIHILRRGVWFLLILGGIGFLMFHLNSRITYFQSNPVNVDIVIETANELRLPLITMCHYSQPLYLIRPSALSDPNMTVVDQLAIAILKSSASRSLRANFSALLANQTYNWTDLYLRYGTQLADTINPSVCLVGKSVCNVSAFATSLTKLGMCHTYDPGAMRSAGAVSSFRVQLVPTDAFDRMFVRLHSDLEMPFEYRNYVQVDYGTRTEIALKMTQISLIKNCGTRQLAYFDDYSRSRCTYEYRCNLTMQMCGCRPFYMPLIDGPVCSEIETNQTKKNCLDEMLYESPTLDDCPEDCEQTTYNWNVMQQSTCASLSFADCKTRNPQLTVYFADLQVMTVEQQAAYDWLAMMSDIGGAFGLILGGCILTIVQVLDTVVAAAYMYLQLLMNRNYGRKRRLDGALPRFARNDSRSPTARSLVLGSPAYPVPSLPMSPLSQDFRQLKPPAPLAAHLSANPSANPSTNPSTPLPDHASLSTPSAPAHSPPPSSNPALIPERLDPSLLRPRSPMSALAVISRLPVGLPDTLFDVDAAESSVCERAKGEGRERRGRSKAAQGRAESGGAVEVGAGVCERRASTSGAEQAAGKRPAANGAVAVESSGEPSVRQRKHRRRTERPLPLPNGAPPAPPPASAVASNHLSHLLPPSAQLNQLPPAASAQRAQRKCSTSRPQHNAVHFQHF